MKRLILLLTILLISTNCFASDIEGDTNSDGVLSGSEQYLLENPNIEGATPERVFRAIQKEKQRQEKIALWEEQDAINAKRAAYQRRVERAAAYQRYVYQREAERSVYQRYVERNYPTYRQ